ncbi:MAG: glycosyltransferase family 39 protein [Lentisphaeria bacterium]|nr:glycosyltransferase family 39 protein [Lentisphaeria bacterium]
MKVRPVFQSPALILPLLMLGALAVRLIYLAEAPMETRDGISYVNFTRQWFEMGQAAIPSFDRVPPPLFCYLGRGMMFLGLSAATALLTINMTCGVLLLIPAYLIGKSIYDDRSAGFRFAGFAAVMPPLVEFSCIRLRESLYLFLVFWVVSLWIMAIRSRRRGEWFAALCGALAVIAIYCRYEALELLAFVVLSLPVIGLFPHWQWRRAAVIALFVAGGVIVAAALMHVLPGMPDVLRVFYNRIYAQCLGTSLNPL